ncbi:hypothetical protein JZ751_020611 [Albula glossodonta]|uniref:Uncharacterized protein n=1 Tax=Albula glossodonta TaxID=121402 RepID=A0A8T2PNB8_9TELE|nr:hypothetical protein JZ751_020611 [Albula glossodonta]
MGVAASSRLGAHSRQLHRGPSARYTARLVCGALKRSRTTLRLRHYLELLETRQGGEMGGQLGSTSFHSSHDIDVDVPPPEPVSAVNTPTISAAVTIQSGARVAVRLRLGDSFGSVLLHHLNMMQDPSGLIKLDVGSVGNERRWRRPCVIGWCSAAPGLPPSVTAPHSHRICWGGRLVVWMSVKRAAAFESWPRHMVARMHVLTGRVLRKAAGHHLRAAPAHLTTLRLRSDIGLASPARVTTAGKTAASPFFSFAGANPRRRPIQDPAPLDCSDNITPCKKGRDVVRRNRTAGSQAT